MSFPVVYLDPTVDHELSGRLGGIITKHQVNKHKSHRKYIIGDVLQRQKKKKKRWLPFSSNVNVLPLTGYNHRWQNTCQPPHISLTCFCRRRSAGYVHFLLSFLNVRFLFTIIYYTFFFLDEWMRPVMQSDKHILVHWGMHPDRQVHIHTCVILVTP